MFTNVTLMPAGISSRREKSIKHESVGAYSASDKFVELRKKESLKSR